MPMFHSHEPLGSAANGVRIAFAKKGAVDGFGLHDLDRAVELALGGPFYEVKEQSTQSGAL